MDDLTRFKICVTVSFLACVAVNFLDRTTVVGERTLLTWLEVGFIALVWTV